MRLRRSLFPVLMSGAGHAAAAVPWYLADGDLAANCVAAYAAKGAADQASSYVNLANPGTYNLTATAAPTWNAATGWTSNGSKFLVTGITPDTDQTYTALVRFALGDGAQKSILGILNTAGSVALDIEPGASAHQYYHWGSLNFASVGVGSTGSMGVAGNKAYLNGVAETGTMSGFSGSLPAGGIYLLGRNFNGALNNGIVGGSILAVAFYSVTKTPTQMAALHTAIMAL